MFFLFFFEFLQISTANFFAAKKFAKCHGMEAREKFFVVINAININFYFRHFKGSTFKFCCGAKKMMENGTFAIIHQRHFFESNDDAIAKTVSLNNAKSFRFKREKGLKNYKSYFCLLR